PATASKRILRVVFGANDDERLDPRFQGGEWQEYRLQVDGAVSPTIVGNIFGMPDVPADNFDAIQSWHHFQRLFACQVPLALAEFRRVLKPGGLLLLVTSNLPKIAEQVVAGNLERYVAQIESVPLMTIDLIFGSRDRIAQGD